MRTYNPQPMSQITRCPSCETTFKVVADQLRISDGWVRCGQCKEVFHAASNLQATPAEPLLPELPLDQWRSADDRSGPAPQDARGSRTDAVAGPANAPSAAGPVPAVGAAGGLKVWSSPRAAASGAPEAHPGTVTSPGAPTLWATPAVPAEAPGFPDADADADAAAGRDAEEVPAFLSAAKRAQAVETPAWNLEPLTPFGWRTRQELPAAEPFVAPPPPSPAEGPADAKLQPAPAAPLPMPERSQPGDMAPDSGGYELPFAELRDSGWPEDLELDLNDAAAAAIGTHSGNQPLGQVVEGAEPPWAADPLDTLVALEAQAAAEAGPVVSARSVEGDEPSGAALLRKADAGDEAAQADGAPSLMPSHAPAAPRRRLGAAHRNTAGGGGGGGGESMAEQEPGFIRVARRQALWRRPAVRAALVSVVVLLTVFLALQVAVRERDRIAAQYPSTRAPLQALCAAAGCSLAPPRSIADVVIDSSSFAKGRAEGAFQLQLSLKNRSAMTLAMPAVELTLTDAQDQPVVRRVIRADELGAPAALAAQGEWTGVLPLTVDADANRVAGYRLLAFYP